MKIKGVLVSVVTMMIIAGGLTPAFCQEYPLASKFVRYSTNALGYNFIARCAAQKAIKHSLKKEIKGKLSVKIDSFSGVDLKKGKFKSLSIEGYDLVVDEGIYLSSLNLKTTSDFNYVQYNKKPIVFVTPVPMSYEAVISEEDFNKMLMNQAFYKLFTLEIPLFKIEGVKAKFEEDKIRFSSKIKLPFCKPVKCSVSSGLKVVDGKIIFDNIDTTSLKSDLTSPILELMNRWNLLSKINLYIVDKANTVLEVNTIKISEGVLKISGNVTMNKVQEQWDENEKTITN